jgi:prophage regulatory protein
MSALRLLRLPEVRNRTGLSRTEIYRRMEEETFPKAIPLGKRSIAWRSDEIDAWIEERISLAGETGAARHLQRTNAPTRLMRGQPARAP